MTIQLVLADPYPVMLKGMVCDLAKESDLLVQAEVNNGEAALLAVREFKPDILVLDLLLPKKNGLAVVRELKADGVGTAPVLFTSASPREIIEAVRAGVRGVVTKDMPMNLLVRCIREVYAGRNWLEKDIATDAVAYLLKSEAARPDWEAALTPRELAVARMIGKGLPNKRIASHLEISEGTTKLHLHRIYQKLQVRGRLELMRHMQKEEA